MRILMVQTFYYPRGGDSTQMFNLTRLLEEKGHEVIPFAMHHSQNVPSPYERYFVSEIDYPAMLAERSPRAAWRVAYRSIYNREAKRKIAALISDVNPDIVHLHNFRAHLTSSILAPLERSRVPVVWTLHDCSLVCPNSSFLSHGEVCERCLPNRFYQVLLHRCKKDSLGASFMAMLTSYFDRLIRVPAKIRRFITPSRFLRSKLIEGGIPADRITWIPNFIDLDAYRSLPEQDYFIYVGRLSPEKGLDTLIRAVGSLVGGHLKVVGEGPGGDELRSLAARTGAGRVEFLGFRSGKELRRLIGGSQFLVLPSRCIENLPFSIMEAFASGKAVVASPMGGIPEMVEDGVNGFLFPADDEAALTGCLKQLLGDRTLREEMGRRGRAKAEALYEREGHYRKIIEVYREEMAGTNGR
jgi:glycosyltransferase involved in cell wall biosynthesis